MKELVTRFEEIMREEYALHEELLGFSEKKRDAIVAGSLPQLDLIVREEQMRIARQATLERRRVACVEELSNQTGKPLTEITMLTFAGLAGEEQSGSLRELAEKLSAVLHKLKRNNDINSRMIQGRLEYIHCMVDSAAQTQDPRGYSARGADIPRTEQGAKFYDKRV